MNPNNRFRKKTDNQEDIYVYDIEEHSQNLLKKEKEENTENKKFKKQKIEHFYIKRFVAFLIDIVTGILFLATLCFIMITATVLGLFQGSWYSLAEVFESIDEWSWIFIFGLVFFKNIGLFYAVITTLCQIMFMSLFFAYFESSTNATLGKKIVDLRVIKDDGERLRYDDSFKRNFLRFLIFPLIGFFTEEKRAYHNSWTEAVVVKNANTYKIIE